MTDEAEVRERAKELGYRLIKIPGADRYNLAENHWYWIGSQRDPGQSWNEIETEMWGDDEEDEQPAAPSPAPPPVPAVTPTGADEEFPDTDDEEACMAWVRQRLGAVPIASGDWVKGRFQNASGYPGGTDPVRLLTGYVRCNVASICQHRYNGAAYGEYDVDDPLPWELPVEITPAVAEDLLNWLFPALKRAGELRDMLISRAYEDPAEFED